jgi:hypothetical protein
MANIITALRKIENGATSVYLSAMLHDDPINPDVLLAIIEDIRAAINSGTEATEDDK